MEGERQNKEEEVCNSPRMGRKQRGKFVSLNKQEAKIVLETYVKRSLSNYEGKRTECRKERKVRRSVSDATRFTHRVHKVKIPQAKSQEPATKESEAHLSRHEHERAAVNKAAAAAVKKQSWFKSFLNQLFKKEANTSEQTVRVVDKAAQRTVTSSVDGHSDQTTKRNSIRRALSFKKSNTEKKMKRPTHLPLKQVSRPHPPQPCEANENYYYEQVSAEIELLVKDTENLDVTGSGDLNTDGTEDMETVIKKIVAILQREGDAYNRKVKNDPTISNFFRDISYNSFKQLADVYIDKEIKKRDSAATPEDIKFAFSVHFTKQVVGLSTHPANRIMGFGNKYLQDTFTWLSYSRENLTVSGLEECISPD
ncbi:apoptosis facilitator Bcl-2-like protein 14 [Dendropsophus ebraccatus]|uniref:apoptosis facilitator Bcl-2-like protein 14 n=1 Tax=Dendropsophus ebraccatus TaxID=150705 RepID=UPI0038313DB4